MRISIDALMDKLKQVRKLGIKNNFKNIDSYTYNQINNLADDLDFIIEKDQHEDTGLCTCGVLIPDCDDAYAHITGGA